MTARVGNVSGVGVLADLTNGIDPTKTVSVLIGSGGYVEEQPGGYPRPKGLQTFASGDTALVLAPEATALINGGYATLLSSNPAGVQQGASAPSGTGRSMGGTVKTSLWYAPFPEITFGVAACPNPGEGTMKVQLTDYIGPGAGTVSRPVVYVRAQGFPPQNVTYSGGAILTLPASEAGALIGLGVAVQVS